MREDPRDRDRGPVAAIAHRFVAADGTTHVRALAYQSMFIALSGFVGAVGLASLLDVPGLRGVMEELGRSISPGPAGRLLGEAAGQGASGGTLAAVFGLGSALVSGTFAMAQIERSANRMGGSLEDRSIPRRYVVAFLLAATIGVMLAAGALALGAGRAVASGLGWSDEVDAAWSILRWPIGLAMVSLAVALLFRAAPRRRLGPRRAILWGSAVAVVLWVAFTGLLSLYFSIQTSSTYGSLLAIVALLLWSMLTSLALHLGIATACELAGAPHPDRADGPVHPTVSGDGRGAVSDRRGRDRIAARDDAPRPRSP